MDSAYGTKTMSKNCIDEFDKLISEFNSIFTKTNIFAEKGKIIRTLPPESYLYNYYV